jgi:HlyD family type I secretion membrane fusion protein
MTKHPFQRSFYSRNKKPKESPTGLIINPVESGAPPAPRITAKTGIARLADDAWMDAMAENPRIKKWCGWMDDKVAFLTKRTYETDNPALAAARGPIVFGMWMFIFVFIFMFGWATFAPLSSASVAPGSVVLNANKKVIQHLEGGIIEEILVKEGQKVNKGDPLIRLNETTAKARQVIFVNQLNTARATEARLLAERDGKDEVEFPEDMIVAADNPEVANLLAAQHQLFETRRATYQGQLDITQQRIRQLKDEINGLTAQQQAAAKQIKLIEEEVGTVEKLVAKGQALKPRLLSLQRAAANLAGERGQYTASIARAKQAIGENELDGLNIKNKYLSEVVGQLRETQDMVAELTEKMRASADILERIVISAPQAGIISGLRVHTKGGVIQPAQPLMDLVPQDDVLIIEAQVNPQDIDNVHPGLKARVRLSAYRTRDVPMLDGVVETVSADRLVDEKAGTAYYLARIVINQQELDDLKHIELYPGMPADVLIITGERTFMSYFLSPLMQSSYKALREE